LKKDVRIKLKETTSSDFRFLYQLLAERDPIANISHRRMPTYKEHVQFVKSRPYTKWYVIYFNDRKAGSIYLSKQDEIGIFVKKVMQDKGIGSIAMAMLMKKNHRDRFLANVSPKNKKSAEFFKRNGFVLIQHTYELGQ